MTQDQPHLYPRLSSIYNKIMQLAIAIIIIVVAMNLWVKTYSDQKVAINTHFSAIADDFINQMAITTSTLWDDEPIRLQEYINQLANTPWIKDISVYDETGELIASSGKVLPVISLYGLLDGLRQDSRTMVPIVHAIRAPKLKGYIKITVITTSFVASLEDAREEQFTMFRIMMILAGIVGFLLTRGLNRFSRQGYRLNRK